MPRSPRSTAVLAAVLVGTAGLTACNGPTQAVARPSPTTTFTADVPVLVPGAPGEEAEVVRPGETREIANADYYGDADVAFVTDMAVHHAQALEMADLVSGRSADERVQRLAARIALGQEPEIAAMEGWLAARGLPAPRPGAHSAHAGMPGMATPEDLTRLAAAKGTDFDRMFLELMTRHHEGALLMAVDPGGAAQHPQVAEMVKDTQITQSAEIGRMQELLADL